MPRRVAPLRATASGSVSVSLMTVRLLASLAIACAAVGGAAADPTAPGDPSRLDNLGPTGVFVGSSNQPMPDPKTGAFHWSYAFQLPAARGLAQPELALSYSSAARDREAGYGWGLSYLNDPTSPDVR